jgi:hypothetical protein
VAKSGSLIAELGNAAPGDDKKRAVKPKTGRRSHMVTKGEKSVTNPGQQHGELPSYKAPTERALVRDHAKSTMRNATQSWISGHMTTAEHSAVHARARHVLEGKRPLEFKGKSGERKIKGL